MPDGSDRVAFLGDLVTDNIFDLFTVPGAGNATPRRFNLNTNREQGLVGLPIFSPDGGRSVFRGEFDTAGVFELYSIATTDGGGTPVKLNGPLVGDVQGEFSITPNGQNVVYLAEQDSSREELYVVPLLGGVSRRLNGDLPNGHVKDDFKISPDNQYVVYRGSQNYKGEELYAVPLAGGAAFRLSGAMQPLGRVTGFQISADSSTVLYRVDQDTDNLFELYRVPLAGGTAVRLSGAEVTRGIDDFEISPDSARVVYENERLDGNSLATDLYSVPLARGTPLRLNNPLPSGGFVSDFQINGAGDRVVFEGTAETKQLFEVFSVPIAGGTVVKLSGDLSAAGGTRGFSISPDDTVVVFGVDHDPSFEQILEMWVTPIAGGASMRIAGPLPLNRSTRLIEFDPSGTGIVYSADQAAQGREKGAGYIFLR